MGDHLLLTSDKLSVEAASEAVAHESCGATSMFVGTTRDHFDGRKVLRLEYEAYEAMALKALKSLCSEMRDKWPDIHGIAIHHRLGHVAAREASVVIAVSSAHRRESLDAVAHCIERLKATVPVWKKEIYEEQAGAGGDSGAWKQNSECATKKRKQQPTETDKIDKSLIQINVSYEELESRINNFIERKREQVNLSNVRDFIPSRDRDTEADSDGSTCARVRTVFTKRSDSKGHLKVHRVNNEWGPQTVRQAAQPGAPAPPAPPARAGGSLLPSGVEERVLDAERFLNIHSVTPDVYKRLKEVEDRIRHLESVSPEYAAFWRCNSGDGAEGGGGGGAGGAHLHWRYTTDEIDRKIEQLEKHNSASWNMS